MVVLPFSKVQIKVAKPKPAGYPKQIVTIGDKLRAKRMDLGLLQRDVAKILNVTCSSVENWERNRYNPGKSTLIGIRGFLDA